MKENVGDGVGSCPVAQGMKIMDHAGAEYLGFNHPITDVAFPGEHVSIRTVDLAAKTYNRSVAQGYRHPLTSSLTSKGYKLTEITEPGQKILRGELYGPRPTPAQVEALYAAREELNMYNISMYWGFRP